MYKNECILFEITELNWGIEMKAKTSLCTVEINAREEFVVDCIFDADSFGGV